ncbi:CRS1_YhbY domain-containing protein [Cephalotus follicularis]|uniref:CRS1_YhbY domain-containing protein n=1 Tax=Cephalotus follicularis TaxID=3775 RepID=A0A1Q3B3B7_CEPFO|nr:CRS1_YhbY domain-containing protein [Cephalotus follicularis]
MSILLSLLNPIKSPYQSLSRNKSKEQVMAAASLSSSHLLNHHLHPSLQPPISLSLLYRPLSLRIFTATTTTKILSKYHQKQPYTNTTNTHFSFTPLSFSSLLTHNLLSCHSMSTTSLSLDQQQIEDVETEEEIEDIDDGGSEDTEVGSRKSESLLGLKRSEGLPTLTVKEKKELSSYAHGLGKKLKTQLVGKSGVTENVATSFVETLEANELLKIKIHRTCPGELEDVVKRLEELTGSVVVGQIGRTVIIYRPSITKLEAEEKKKQAMKVFIRQRKATVGEEPKSKLPFPRVEPRPYARRRRGSRRV